MSFVVLAIALLAMLQYWLLSHFTPKIAYVRSDKLLTEYIGMKEAKDIFNQKQMQWQANIDSLKGDISQYKSFTKPSKDRIMQMEQNLALYTQQVNALVVEEDRKATEAVYSQINAFIEEYGKKNRYSIILGSGTSNTLLYGDNAMDITDELLQALNENYNPNYGK